MVNFIKKHWRIILPIGLILIGVLIWRLFFYKNNSVTYQTAKVEKSSIIASVSASGQIITSNLVNLNTNTKGLIKNVYVKDGDQVKTGQKIMAVTLDSDGQQKYSAAYASYLSAKNSLDSANSTLYTLDSSMWAVNQKFINDAVARSLLTYDPTYIQQHDDWLAAEAKYKNQQSVVNQARSSLNSAWLSYQTTSPVILAPQSGTITNLTYVSGMTIDGSSTPQRVAVITLSGTPKATFSVSQIDILKIKPNQKATITIDSLPDKTFTGQVVSVDKIGTTTSGVTTYPVIINFDLASVDILSNMSATANIILDSKDNVLVVMNSAIRQVNNQSVVRVLKNNQEYSVTVETGLTSDTYTEITAGLNEGDEVITSTTAPSSSTSNSRSVFSGGGFGGAARVIGR